MHSNVEFYIHRIGSVASPWSIYLCLHRPASISICVSSQAGLHEQYGGVKPDVARDAHARAIQETVDSCLAEAGVRPEDLTAVAVTVGPGLSLCLQVGRGEGTQTPISTITPSPLSFIAPDRGAMI